VFGKPDLTSAMQKLTVSSLRYINTEQQLLSNVTQVNAKLIGLSWIK